MLTNQEALIYTGVMGAVIFFCRLFPFLLFHSKEGITRKFTAFLNFVEKAVPPAAMAVLAFNALSVPFRNDFYQGIPGFLAAVLTALLHLWKRNTFLSILGGTLGFMLLHKLMGG